MTMTDNRQTEQWRDSLALASRWLAEVAMIATDTADPETNRFCYEFSSWKGVLREYDAGTRQWLAFGPHWHTSQAVTALLAAHRRLGDGRLLEAARRGADFLLRERISDPADPDYGVLLAYEGYAPSARIIEISGMLESLNGLFQFSAATGETRYADAAITTLDWIARRAFNPDEGLIVDTYEQKTRNVKAFARGKLVTQGRPLIEDAVFLTGYQRSEKPAFRAIFFALADRLLRDEDPPGNWISYRPCNKQAGTLHPRQAYWWGRPMIAAWQASGESKYLDCAVRVAEWYRRAQRADGGLFRGTYTDFRTDSFGHATSGILCASLLWRDLIVAGRGDAYREPLQRALAYARALQFIEPADANLKGAILEKVRMPDGTDRLPFVVRDLATIFYVQALAAALEDGLI